MATLQDLLAKWETRRAEAARLKALVPLETIAGEIIAELAALAPSGDEVLSLAEAAQESGYSVDRLQHLVAEGAIPNAGRKGKPGIRRRDLPRKPTAALPTGTADSTLSSRRRIVLAARTSAQGGA